MSKTEICEALDYLVEYKSLHRSKLESRGWEYIGSVEHQIALPNGSISVRWKHFFSKGRRIVTTGTALKLEGFKA